MNARTNQFKRVFFKSLFLEDVFYRSFWNKTSEITDFILSRYYPQIPKEQKCASSIVNEIKQSHYVNTYIQLMNDYKIELLYPSFIHGKSHAERVSLLSCWLAIVRELPMEDFILCIECAKYHDIGRINDNEDPLHGKRGTNVLAQIEMNISEVERSILNAVITAHSLDDTCAQEIFLNYGIVDKSAGERGFCLLNILKDADALDRFRLNNNSLFVQKLRTPEAVKIIRAACEFVNL